MAACDYCKRGKTVTRLRKTRTVCQHTQKEVGIIKRLFGCPRMKFK